MKHCIYLNRNDLLDAASDTDFLVMLIPRVQIDDCLVGDLVDRLLVLSDSTDYTIRYAQAVAFAVDGYDDDPRELPTIPEVVKYFRALNEAWPYSFNFFDIESGALILFTHFQIDAVALPTNNLLCLYEVDSKILSDLSRKQFSAMNALHDLHEVPTKLRERITQRIIETMNMHFPNS